MSPIATLLSRCSALVVLSACLAVAIPLATAQVQTPPEGPAPVGKAPSTGDSPAPGAAAAGTSKSSERQREGTKLVDITGTFQSIGTDGVTFSPAGEKNKESYRLLENLALERIIRTLDENRGSRQGVASGELTEFRGANYLLIKKFMFPSQEGDSAGGQ